MAITTITEGIAASHALEGACPLTQNSRRYLESWFPGRPIHWESADPVKCALARLEQRVLAGSRQRAALELVDMLRDDYGVPIGSIRKHEDIKGKHTACPGKHFPFERLITELMRS